MKAIIVEDDLSIALDYEMLLNRMGIDLLGTFTRAEDCLNALGKLNPDFIILDLQLEGNESGLSLAGKIQHLYIPFIVITGHPVEALMQEAKDLNAEAFLVKPINIISLEFEIKKIEDKLLTDSSQNKFLAIKDRGAYINIPYSDVIYIEIEGNYSTIYTLHKRFVLKKSLTKVWQTLDKDLFMRVHRGFVVNREFISKISFSKKQMILTNDVSLPIGKNYFDELKNYLESKTYL